MMKRLALAALVAFAPLAASARSALDPVTRVMDIAMGRMAGTAEGTVGYFDHLEKDFSAAFVAAYRAAQKYPAYEGSDYPFDYDVITSSQDGCPLEDVSIQPGAGSNVVDVSFRLWGCAPDAESRGKVSELKFDIVTENGEPVIADIHRLSEGKWDSLVAEMQEMVRFGEGQQ